jgi:uncharacterized protein YodC (DUF2158 family)
MTKHEAPFKSGDIVRVKGISGPNMMVCKLMMVSARIYDSARCLWFDNQNRPIELDFSFNLLEKAE